MDKHWTLVNKFVCGGILCFGYTAGNGGIMRESFEKNKKGILLMVIAAVFACVGQLLWKLSVTEGIYFMMFGFVLYGVGALLMLIAYRYGSVSVLQPMLSTNYVLSAILGFFVLQEELSVLKAVGIVIITSGVILIGGGDAE